MTNRVKAIIQGIEDIKKLKILFYMFGQRKRYKRILLLLTEYKQWSDINTPQNDLFEIIERYREN